jgi:ribosomal protein S18 acetylase RimI-like enzyme
MKIKPLDSRNKMEIHALVMEKPQVNIFLLERLLHGNIQGWGMEEWHGVFVERKLIAISFCGGRKSPSKPAKLFTGYGSLETCDIISAFLKKRGGFEIAIGEDLFIQSIVEKQNEHHIFNYAQDYMTCTKSEIDYEANSLDVEPAVLDDFDTVYKNSGLMIQEDLGYNPCITRPERQKNLIKKRIEEDRVLVGKQNGQIVFQIEVGVLLSVGCQVGSTYIPSLYRGQGLSTLYMRGVCRYLLEQTQSINLHVHIDNMPAQRCYQKTGFRKITNYRLVKCL